MLKILYGYTTSPHGDDPLVRLSDHVNANFFRACDVFGRLIEYLPAVKWLPDGFPGTNFKAEAREHSRNAQLYAEKPYQFARRQMASQKDANSFVARLVQEHIGEAEELNEADEHAIKWSAAGLQLGGSETTVTVTRTFILATIMFPEIQRKAQEEVDRVTGGTRLPVLADQEQMPFVSAIFAEALRFFPTAPLGFPHTLSEDMTYKGYDLPKGAFLLPEIWEFCHGRSIYSDPFKFDPERFLEPRNEPSPLWTVFGFGRRICPGRHLAHAALFLKIACLVAFFDFSKAVDEQGNVMEPKVELDPVRSAVAKVAPFPFKVTVRSEKHAELLKALEKDYPVEEGDVGLLGELSLL
jgi:cytochrome P450